MTPLTGASRSLLALLASLLLVTACGGSPTTPATPSDPAGSSVTTPVAGGGSIGDDPEAAITSAIESLARLDSYRFAIRFEGAFGSSGELGSVDVAGTVRQQPVAASKFVTTSGETVNTWIAIGEKGWFNTKPGPDEFVDTTAAQVAKQNRTYLWSTIRSQLEADRGHYEPVGAETVNGIQAVHLTLDESRRAKRSEILKVDVAAIKSDVWLTADGRLVRYLDGQIDTATSIARGEIVTFDVLEADCTCPIDPPA